jgi:hypothetical protein
MITKSEAKKIAKECLIKNKIEYSSLTEDENKIRLIKDKEIAWGSKQNEILDVYIYDFAQIWGIEERGFGLYIDANTGKPLYIIAPHGYLDVEE